MATVGSDTFTDVNNTSLDAHTPDVGAGWTEETGGFIIAAPGVNLSKTGTTDEYARKGDDIGDDDMDVTAVCRTTLSTARKAGVAGRMTTADFANAYEAHLVGDGATVDVKLFKEIAGVRTELGSFDLNGTTEVDVTLKLEIRTAAKKVYCDGVERISSADDSLTGNNYAGVFENGAAANVRIDSFVSESVAGAGTVVPQIVNSYRRRRQWALAG